ncbi:MAG: hypothetical protein ACK55I_41960 [bacterium]|jgi:predicted transcriptional regulator
MNTWSIVDGDIVLSSDNEEEMQFANAWILNLVQAIRQQTIEELQNGRSIISDYEQPELPEVPC